MSFISKHVARSCSLSTRTTLAPITLQHQPISSTLSSSSLSSSSLITSSPTMITSINSTSHITSLIRNIHTQTLLLKDAKKDEKSTTSKSANTTSPPSRPQGRPAPDPKRKRPNLFDILASVPSPTPLPAGTPKPIGWSMKNHKNGVGLRFARSFWSRYSEPSYYRITRVKPFLNGVKPKAWGILVWRGQTDNKEVPVRGAFRRGEWQQLPTDDPPVVYRNKQPFEGVIVTKVSKPKEVSA